MRVPYLSSRLLDGSPREWDLPLLPTERGRSGHLPLLPRWPARSARMERRASPPPLLAAEAKGDDIVGEAAAGAVRRVPGFASLAVRELAEGLPAERQLAHLHLRLDLGCLLGHRYHLLSGSVSVACRRGAVRDL